MFAFESQPDILRSQLDDFLGARLPHTASPGQKATTTPHNVGADCQPSGAHNSEGKSGGATSPRRPRIRAVMVETIDGAAWAPDGKTADLGGETDTALFERARVHCDGVVVGLNTALLENYGPVETNSSQQSESAHSGGLSAKRFKELFLLTRSIEPDKAREITHSLDLAGPLPTSEPTPETASVTASETASQNKIETKSEKPPAQSSSSHITVVLTGHTEADADLTSESQEILREAGISLLELPPHPTSALHSFLEWIGTHREDHHLLNLEGGPRLLGEFIANELVDELILTVHPALASGSAPRIAYQPEDAQNSAAAADLLPMTLHSLGTDDNHTLFLRYIRQKR